VPDNQLTVRRVRPADYATVFALRLEMLADTPLAYLDTVAEHVARPSHIWRERIEGAATGCERGQFIAIAGDGHLLGQAIGITHDSFRGATIVVAVYVTPAARGGTVLADLMAAVATWSRECGRETLVLEVVEGNNQAERAYQKLGFTRTGRRVAHPVLPGLYEFAMARPA
jgi:L-amino acid N-acyltransferase YncA